MTIKDGEPFVLVPDLQRVRTYPNLESDAAIARRAARLAALKAAKTAEQLKETA